MDQSTITTILLIATVGFVAYLIGDRRASKRAEEAAKKENFGAIREPPKRSSAPPKKQSSAPPRAAADDDEEAEAAASAAAGVSKPASSAKPASDAKGAASAKAASTSKSAGDSPMRDTLNSESDAKATPSVKGAGKPVPAVAIVEAPAKRAATSAPPSSGKPKPFSVIPPAARVAHDAKARKAAEPEPDEVPSLGDYEEDEAVEPTMVGQAASAPPSERVIRIAPIKKILLDPEAPTEEPVHETPLFLVSATAQTDKGLRRKRNEDSLGVLESRNLFVVADGMGGYAGGEEASKLSVEVVVDAFRSNTFEGAPHEGFPREASEIARAIQMANATVGERAQQEVKLRGMGTTIVTAVFSPNKRRMYIGHVGDSRCYRMRESVFTQLTADHTMAEFGIKGPESNQLSRAVGIWPTVTIDVLMDVPKTGDTYLLCSDGLTKMLNDDTIANVLRNEADPKAAVERLIFFANSRGGKDNITVILIRVVPIDWKPE